MANLAVVCPPLPGHLNPLAVLGRTLQERGHRVTVFQIPALREAVRTEGLKFYPVGTTQSGTLSANIESMSRLRGLQSVKFAIECSRQISDLLCLELPQALKEADIDLVLADQNEPAAGSVCEFLQLPFVNVCPSLPLNPEPDVPPPFLPWQYRPGMFARVRNWLGYRITDRLIAPINQTINNYRQAWNLPLLRKPDESFSKSAQLCQMPREFDFPRRNLPAGFHYLGPFVGAPRKPVSFPFERLDGRPLVFASLGTLQEKDSDYFDVIAQSCAASRCSW
jgi:zeaxanthin glucosyltransferase